MTTPNALTRGDPPATLEQLETPALVLDRGRLVNNIRRLRERLDALGVTLRPHLKTAKSIDVARLVMPNPWGPITVSTLKEAEYFAGQGVRDILYAVGVAPVKLPHVARIRGAGADLAVIVDSVEAARAVSEFSRAAGDRIPVLIEIDSDGHRSGVQTEDGALLLAVGRAVHDGGAELRGVMTHAGASYDRHTPDALAAIAEQERAAAVRCAGTLRAAGLPCPVVSVGSTPTAHFARRLDGVTEVRAGVYLFFDLVMAGIGVCGLDDIAISVLASVIGHQRRKGWILVDAGWMAMSRDRGTAKQALDQGYGVVCDLDGKPFPDLIMADANQEHGIIALRQGSGASLPELPVGSLVRILPNHACATAAQHDAYRVVDGGRTLRDRWPRFSGW
jgi:D-serine deaminase-like pyridoxal phosphate-dependent protein